ncbi:hypothetical protein ACFFJY_06605 [Fictibacillus aquaticus]|uniref:Lipoprotein n=1 Tax=Fictibacillus aquaticus TaxID=2021314 RepID=A0A235FB12_9BACL|nr:hypothetical protein [Fictibacillus aquaticus]OYD58127.1 hypothetical protein CGZ90_09605 [Fictibacillus aquaticus]
MKNKAAWLSAFLLTAGILSGCGKEEKADKPEQKKTEQSTQDTKTESASVEKSETAVQVTAYEEMKAEMEKAKEGQEVDWEKVSGIYTDKLQKHVTEVDESGEMDQAITAAIEGAKNKEMDNNIARQLTDKVTQSYFYQKQKRLHKDAAAALEGKKESEANLAFGELKLLAEKIFVPTAVKRDDYYKLQGEASIVEGINNGLAAQEKALKEGNVEDFKVFVQLTDKSVYRSYYLASNSYAEKIAAGVKEGKPKEELLQEQAEAWGFFQAIKGSLSGGDEAAAAEINKLFTLNETKPEAIDPQQVNQLFTKAFAGKISGYLEKAPKALEDGEATEAKVGALEGIVFLKAIEMDLQKKLGQEEAKLLLDDSQKWFEAISSDNKEEASKLGEKLNAGLTKLSK